MQILYEIKDKEINLVSKDFLMYELLVSGVAKRVWYSAPEGKKYFWALANKNYRVWSEK